MELRSIQMSWGEAKSATDDCTRWKAIVKAPMPLQRRREISQKVHFGLVLCKCFRQEHNFMFIVLTKEEYNSVKFFPSMNTRTIMSK